MVKNKIEEKDVPLIFKSTDFAQFYAKILKIEPFFSGTTNKPLSETLIEPSQISK